MPTEGITLVPVDSLDLPPIIQTAQHFYAVYQHHKGYAANFPQDLLTIALNFGEVVASKGQLTAMLVQTPANLRSSTRSGGRIAGAFTQLRLADDAMNAQLREACTPSQEGMPFAFAESSIATVVQAIHVLQCESALTPVWYHGMRKDQYGEGTSLGSYSLDGKHPQCVPPEEHKFLQAFLGANLALDTRHLLNCGISNPADTAE
jgi:hypothetical protein